MQDVAAGSIEIDRVHSLAAHDTIIDIRHPDEQEHKPRNFAPAPSLIIPFYQLSQKNVRPRPQPPLSTLL